MINLISNYLLTNPKQCGLKNDDIEKRKKKIMSKLNKINDIKDEINKDLYFDILRECIYRENINFKKEFSKSTWFSIFSENFFNTCIDCNKKLKKVNWNCCDIYCPNCNIKYEVKSKMNNFLLTKNIKINLGNSIGVYEFFENIRNYILIHFMDGYYYIQVKNIYHKNCFIVVKEKNVNYELNIIDFLEYLKKNEYHNNFEKSKSIKNIDLYIPKNILLKIKTNIKRDVNKNNIEKQINEISKIFLCNKKKKKNLIYDFII